MLRILPILLAIFAFSLFTACNKDGKGDEEDMLHGTWVKGFNTGDTLVFFERNGKHYLRSNQSFNPGMYSPSEREYRFQNGKLFFRYVWSGSSDYFEIDSFTWKVPAREFEVQGVQLYMFMSSTMTKFTFTKIP